jgi:hypothetical protein
VDRPLAGARKQLAEQQLVRSRSLVQSSSLSQAKLDTDQAESDASLAFNHGFQSLALVFVVALALIPWLRSPATPVDDALAH